jgi:hypothetical protein
MLSGCAGGHGKANPIDPAPKPDRAGSSPAKAGKGAGRGRIGIVRGCPLGTGQDCCGMARWWHGRRGRPWLRPGSDGAGFGDGRGPSSATHGPRWHVAAGDTAVLGRTAGLHAKEGPRCSGQLLQVTSGDHQAAADVPACAIPPRTQLDADGDVAEAVMRARQAERRMDSGRRGASPPPPAVRRPQRLGRAGDGPTRRR